MKNFVEKRPLFCCCMTAITSSIICSLLNSMGIFVFCIALIFASLFIISVKTKFRSTIILAFALSVLVAITSYVYSKFIYEPSISLCGKTVTVDCTALSEVKEDDDNKYAIVHCFNVFDGSQTYKVNFNTKIKLEKDVNFLPTTNLRLKLRFLDKNYIQKFASGGIHTQAYAESVYVLEPIKTRSFYYTYYLLRNEIKDSISIGDSDTSAFVKGMIFGDKDSISHKFQKQFRTIGLSHVTSVSGMHLMFAVLLVDFFLIILGFGYKPRAIAALIAMLVFATLSGFPVSCVRSIIMLSIYYIGRLFDKIHDGLTSLSISAFIIVLFTPYNIRNVSFMLSVCACFGIILITPILNSFVKINVKNRILSKILFFVRGTMSMSVGANIACIPIFVLCFKEISLIAPISNVLLITPIQILFYLGFVSIAFSNIPCVTSCASIIAKSIYEFIEKSVEICYNFKYISINCGYKYFYLVVVVFLVLFIGVFCYTKNLPNRKIWPYVTIYVMMCLVLFVGNLVNNYGIVRVDYVDVGQGNCTVVSSDEKAVIVDCGGTDITKLRDCLMHTSVKNIKMIALTHFDSDHSKYLEFLLDNYSVEKIIYPSFADKKDITELENAVSDLNVSLIGLSQDCDFEIFDNVSLNVFVEKAFLSKINSNTSVLYKLNCYNSSAIFPGDMDIHQEHVYLKYGEKLDCDVLLAAHHGSNTSSLQRILNLYSPDYTVISVGKNNAYKLPGDRAIARLNSCSTVLRTDIVSTVTFVFNRKGYRLINYGN